jgi:predicted DNA-binding transcriptional regulator AlpA
LFPDVFRQYALSAMALPKPRKRSEKLRTSDVASILGISERTLLRKLAAGVVPEPARDRSNNYRLWRPEDVGRIQEALREKE